MTAMLTLLSIETNMPRKSSNTSIDMKKGNVTDYFNLRDLDIKFAQCPEISRPL